MAIIQNRLNWPLLFIAILVIFLPLLPLTVYPEIKQADRYLFIPWVACSAFLAAIFPHNAPPIVLTSLSFISVFSLAEIYTDGKNEVKTDIEYWDAIYPLAISLNKTTEAIFLGNDTGYKRLVLTGARNAADKISNRSTNEKIQIIDENNLGRLNYIKKMDMQIFEFADRKMMPMSQNKIKEKIFPNSEIATTKETPLEIELTLRSGFLSWKLGPHNGNYLVNFISPPMPFSMEFIAPREANILWANKDPLKISFCYSSAENKINACSPEIAFNLGEDKTMAWHGTAWNGLTRQGTITHSNRP